MSKHTFIILIAIILMVLVFSGTSKIFADLLLLAAVYIVTKMGNPAGALLLLIMLCAGAFENVLLCIGIVITLSIAGNVLKSKRNPESVKEMNKKGA